MTFINPFTPQAGKGRQSRPCGFLDDLSEERCRRCMAEIARRHTELFPPMDEREKEIFKTYWHTFRYLTVAEGNFVFEIHSRIGRKGRRQK
jgi:hypothetical protein